MTTLTIDGKDYLINDDVAELIVLISKERDELLESAKSSAVSDVFAALGTIEEHECSSKV